MTTPKPIPAEVLRVAASVGPTGTPQITWTANEGVRCTPRPPDPAHLAAYALAEQNSIRELLAGIENMDDVADAWTDKGAALARARALVGEMTS